MAESPDYCACKPRRFGIPLFRLSRSLAVVLGACAGLIMPVMPAAAQASSVEPETPAPVLPSAQERIPEHLIEPTDEECRVFAVDDSASGTQQLFGRCQDRVLVLGEVTSFEAISNEALAATLVDARRGEERRVLLLTFQEDGQPLSEDLTGQIALMAGRGPMSGIDGVELDLKAFAKSGEIGLQPAPQDRGRARADRINLGEQIAFERARRSQMASKN